MRTVLRTGFMVTRHSRSKQSVSAVSLFAVTDAVNGDGVFGFLEEYAVMADAWGDAGDRRSIYLRRSKPGGSP